MSYKNSYLHLILLCLLFYDNITSTFSEIIGTAKDESKLFITPKIYSNIFVRRREEQKMFVKHLQESDNYERVHKMLEIAFNKIIEIVKEQNMTLYQAGYTTKLGFPQEEKLRDAVTLIIENICLAGEVILHIPEISYRVLKTHRDWKSTFNWGTGFVNEFSHIIDEGSVELLDLFRQEINENERSKNYINPYYSTKPPKKEKKPRKRIKKGPRLTRNEL